MGSSTDAPPSDTGHLHRRAREEGRAHDPNADIARRFLEALDTEDVATIETLVAEDVVAHFPGNNSLSGTHHGRDQLFAAFAKGDELTGGIWERELHDITASDDHVILVKLRARRGSELFSWNGANI